MPRAALLIGVSKAGDLPELQAVEDGIDAMSAWAYSQPDMAEHVTVVTDKDEPVTMARLYTAVDQILAAGPPEQLVVYFAGHGFSKSITEYWLLSDAPRRVGEAIDLTASADLARRTGIRHVVFMSDACRTAPEGINAQAVTGTSLFPNVDFFGKSWVDRYYATRIGDPALEIKDKEASAESYTSLYTSVVAKALMGQPADLLVAAEEDARVGELLSWTLSENLPDLVTAELQDLGLDLRLSQEPEGRIESGSVGVISRVKVKRSARLGDEPRSAGRPSTVELANRSLHQLLEDGGLDAATINVALDRFAGTQGGAAAATPIGARVADTTTTLSEGFGPPHHETGSGLKVRGGNAITAVRLSGDGAADFWPEGAATGIASPGVAANSLVQFESGHLAVIPVFDGWFAVLSFDESGTNLIAVDYEPMDYHPRWSEMADTHASRRTARAFITATSRDGVFSPDRPVRQALDTWLHAADGMDPTLAICAAYAQPSDGPDGSGDDPASREAHMQLRPKAAGLDGVLFDLVMLGIRSAAMTGRSSNLSEVSDGRTFPAFPLLTQGWPLQRLYGPALPASLERLGEHLMSSHWTLFEASAEPLLLEAFAKGEL